MKIVPLSTLITPAGSKAGNDTDHPVYSVTKHSGFVPSIEYFKKQIFSRDLEGYKRVRPGDFAYATIHLDEGSIGIAPSHGLISPMYTAFRPNTTEIVPEYLLRFMKSPSAMAQYPRFGNGSVHRRKAIPLNALGQLLVPLPLPDEQRRIATILDHADALRTKRRQILTALESLRQSIFIDMFGDPASNPHGLPTGSIQDLVQSADYGTSEKSSQEGNIAVLRMNNVTYGGDIDLRDLKYMDLPADKYDRYTVRPGDVLFNRTNSAELVGKTAVYHGDTPLAYAGYLVRLRVRDGFSPDYLSGVLNSHYGKATLRGMCKSIVGMANINAKEVQTIRTVIPSAADQARYSQRVERIRAETNRHRGALVALDELFTSLQSRAFRGEL